MRLQGMMVLGLSMVIGLMFHGTASAQVKYGSWQKTDRGNYYRVCTFPKGGYQYLILIPARPAWVYWYNPDTDKFWCCCPTIRHPVYGKDAAAGKDQFLMATRKSNKIEDTEFPEDVSPNIKDKAKAKDKDGSDVDLGCPPPDLPPGI